MSLYALLIGQIYIYIYIYIIYFNSKFKFCLDYFDTFQINCTSPGSICPLLESVPLHLILYLGFDPDPLKLVKLNLVGINSLADPDLIKINVAP